MIFKVKSVGNSLETDSVDLVKAFCLASFKAKQEVTVNEQRIKDSKELTKLISSWKREIKATQPDIVQVSAKGVIINGNKVR